MTFEYVDIIKTRITDINYGGHLGHMELLGLLHEVRLQYLKNFELSEIEIDGCALLMRNLSINYTNQAFWNDKLQIHMKLITNKATIVFNYDVYNLDKDNITATGETIMIFVDKRNQKILKPSIFLKKLHHDSISK